jgi:hypothetical protein
MRSSLRIYSAEKGASGGCEARGQRCAQVGMLSWKRETFNRNRSERGKVVGRGGEGASEEISKVARSRTRRFARRWIQGVGGEEGEAGHVYGETLFDCNRQIFNKIM